MQENHELPDRERNLPAHRAADRPLRPVVSTPHALSVDLRAAEAKPDSDEIDLLSYWQILVKRRWTIIAATAIVVVIALVQALLTTPVYRATASLQIDRYTSQV